MEVISYRDKMRYKLRPQRKLEALQRRFYGNWARLYAFVQRYTFCDTSLDSLGKSLIEGDTFYLSGKDYLRMYPHVCAHIVAHSLGYATPSHAGKILQDAMETGANNCEWLDACYGGDARRMLKDAVTGRHGHTGYMANYSHALYLVRSEMNGTGKTELASWF